MGSADDPPRHGVEEEPGAAVHAVRAALAIPATLLGFALALPIVALAAPFWVVAFLTHWVLRWTAPRPVSWRELVEFEPVVGWKPKRTLNVHALDLSGDAFHVTTDESGWRGRGAVTESEVVVFGDSFAFGFGIDDRYFFAHLARDLRIKAVGCPAYSMVQPLLWMERLAPQLAGKLVVWFIYLGNDLDGSLFPHFAGYRSPFVRAVDGGRRWEVVTDHVRPSKWPFGREPDGVERYLQLCSRSYFSRRVFSACEYLIARARQVCRSAGAALVVVTVPELSAAARGAIARALQARALTTSVEEDGLDREIGEICRRLDVNVVALRDHLTARDYWKRDFHWNERGHRRVAGVLCELYRRFAAGETSRARPMSVAVSGSSPSAAEGARVLARQGPRI